MSTHNDSPWPSTTDISIGSTLVGEVGEVGRVCSVSAGDAPLIFELWWDSPDRTGPLVLSEDAGFEAAAARKDCNTGENGE